MPTAQAFKLCPHLVLAPGRMSIYRDVSASNQYRGSATMIAQAIRTDISRELNLTASAGVAPIKFLAKVALDMNKPDGQFVITPDTMQLVIELLID